MKRLISIFIAILTGLYSVSFCTLAKSTDKNLQKTEISDSDESRKSDSKTAQENTETKKNTTSENTQKGDTSAASEKPKLSVKAKSCILMDADTGKVLYAENENESLYPASVTKIMPLLLFAEAIDSGKMKLTDTVTASPEAAAKGGSQIWLKDGEQMTVEELLKAVAIASANDACCALGEYLAGSESAFTDMMNKRAQELGMKNTHFDNCSGLDDDTDTHKSTAYDIALMSKELLKHETAEKYSTVWMDSLRDGKTQLVNTNKLVRFYKGTTGLKTGTTNKAGKCLSASAKRDGLHLIAVVLGCETGDDRFEGAKALLNYGFGNYENIKPEFDEKLLTKVSIKGGMEDEIMPEVQEAERITLKKGEGEKITCEIDLSQTAEAPVEKGQILGRVIYSLNGEELLRSNIISPVTVDKMGLFDVMVLMLKSFSGCV